MEEINNFQQEPDETLYQILDSRGAIPTMTATNAKTAIQEMAEYSQKWHNRTSRGRSTKTFDRLAAIQAQLNNLGREIKKVNEKVYAAQVGCEQCKGPHYTKDCPLKKKEKLLKKLTTRNLVDFFKEGGYRATAPGKEDLEAYQAQLKQTQEIKSSRFPPLLKLIHTRYAILDLPNTRNPADKHSWCTRASVSVMPLLTFLNLGLGELAHTRLTVELADRIMKYPKGIARNVLVGIGKFTFPIDFIISDYDLKISKSPHFSEDQILSYRPCKIDVYKRKITLRVGEENIIFKSVKPASSLIRRVYMLSLRERMELDLEARLMGETLVRNQGDDLMPTIKEGEVIEEFRTKDEDFDTGIDDYLSYCDDDKKIHIDYKMVYKGNNVIGAVMNVPILVGTFSFVTDFAILENIDAYRDEGMSDVIIGEPFLREVGIKAKRFEGIITLYKNNDEATYQMVRSHPRFKNHTNEQCNKIPPLLKVSEKDKKNGISHAYQKLKGLYKGVLNLGPEYIRNAKTEEWLICGHISVHEME
ncbi:hypothetical protein Tco_1067818 [Tanacetum coccineum]|uniref:Eukaryotic translation initiation factor 3 subunit G n=1 Tax=Tanacetum coccineum TaxID=301880 RepID=A0ABQ5HE14_9ASTR